MAWDVSADSVVRGSSGVAFLLLAIAIAVLHRRVPAVDRRFASGLAIYLGAWGVALVALNFGPRLDPAVDPYLEVAAALIGIVASLGGLMARFSLHVGRRLQALSLLVPGVWLVVSAWAIYDLGGRYLALTGAPVAAPDQYVWYAIGSRVGYFAAFALGMALVVRCEDKGARLLAAALSMWPATVIGEFAVSLSTSAWGLAATALGGLVVLAFAIVWLPYSRAVALTPLVLVNAGIVETGLVGSQSGFVGIVRLVAVALIALAILRHDLLGTGLRSVTARRGTLATVGLASVFVVAQIALPFVSGGVGIALGGLVAAGLTLAGPALQRTNERREGPAVAPSAERLATYREAVRYALRDGILSRKEETHLASLAQHLGIGAADALKVRHEVEDERAGVKRNP